MIRKSTVFIIFILILACSVIEPAAADPSIVQESENKSSNLNFIYVNAPLDDRIEKNVNLAYLKILVDFNLAFDSRITFFIYKDQPSFWRETFQNENNGITTGFANHVDNIVKLTSPSDTSIKSEADMLKVPVHELVHILLPHNYVEIREGIAVYLADQLKPFSAEDIPANLSSLVTYRGGADSIRMQYNLAGYKAKFMIEECFNMNYAKYKDFMNNPEDYTITGYSSESDFLKEFRKYLESRVLLSAEMKFH